MPAESGEEIEHPDVLKRPICWLLGHSWEDSPIHGWTHECNRCGAWR
jgi:hypothetical protein